MCLAEARINNIDPVLGSAQSSKSFTHTGISYCKHSSMPIVTYTQRSTNYFRLHTLTAPSSKKDF